jgi:predicted acetyltransferase
MGETDDVEIRAARPEEADDMLRVLCAAFGMPFDAARPIFYRDPFFDLSHKRLLRTPEDGIVSCLTVIPCHVRVGAAWVPLGGIAGVATQPSQQARGYAGRLLQATIGTLADELRYPLSGLFALSEERYRRLGWETSTQASCRILAAIPRPPGVPSARAATAADRASVRALHASHSGERTGDCLRDDRRWRLIEAAARECAVVGPPGGVTGYAFWERRGDAVHLLEMAGPVDARRGLMDFLGRGQGKIAALEWTAPPGEWRALGLSEAEPEGAVDCVPPPGLMLRLTDAAAALEAVHGANLASVLAACGRTLTVRPADPVRRENNLPLRLTPAGVSAGRASDADWIAADVRALAPVYFGLRTPSQAREAGHLTASSPQALALADALFPPRHPFVAPLDQF